TSLTISIVPVYAGATDKNNFLERKVHEQYRELKDVLKDFETSYRVSIMFNSKFVEKIRIPLTRVIEKKTIETALSSVLTPENITYKKVGEKFYIINGNNSKIERDIKGSADAAV